MTSTADIATLTNTSIALDTLSQRHTNEVHAGPLARTDDVAEASRIVDAGVPEGGYGWVAVTACAVICFWFVGTTYCWGVLQGALVADGLSSPSTLAWIGSLAVASNSIFAMVSARVLQSFGSRMTAALGVCFLAGGEILSGFTVDHVGGLFVTAGVIMGIGVSLNFIVVGSVSTQYFNRKRGLANGIVFAGGGLGGAVISFMMEGFLESMGTAWTFRALGLITLATGLPAVYFIKDRVKPNRRTFIEWTLFQDSRFVILFLAGAVATFPLLVPPFFFPLYARSIGIGSRESAAIVSAFNLSSAVGRISAGLLSDRIGPLNSLAVSLFLNAASLLALWPVSTTLAPLVVFAIINGAAAGGFFSLMPTVAGGVFGSARVSVALGMLVTGWSGGYLMVSDYKTVASDYSADDEQGAPIAGYILAAYGGRDSGFKAYRPAMYYAGSMAMLSTALVGLVRVRISARFMKKV